MTQKIFDPEIDFVFEDHPGKYAKVLFEEIKVQVVRIKTPNGFALKNGHYMYRLKSEEDQSEGSFVVLGMSKQELEQKYAEFEAKKGRAKVTWIQPADKEEEDDYYGQ